MSQMQHVSLEDFEARARAGRVTTKVDADLRMVVALVDAARAAREVLDYEYPAAVGEIDETVHPTTRGRWLWRRLRAALASVPK